MSNLNKIVRRVLLEASPVVQGDGMLITGKPGPDEPQEVGTDAQAPVKSAVKQVKIVNAIAPGVKIDPGAFIESSSIGYSAGPVTINSMLKKDPRQIEYGLYRREIEVVKATSDTSQIVGDCAISKSKVYNKSVVKNSVVSDASVEDSSVDSCEITVSSVAHVKLDTCHVRNLANLRGDDFDSKLTAMYSTFDLVQVRGRGTISQSKLSASSAFYQKTGGEVNLLDVKTRIASCTITETSISLYESGGRSGSIILADIDQSMIGDSSGGAVTIKGVSGSPVDIGYAEITGNASIIATKSGKPIKVIGFPDQPAIVSGNAKVYGSAYVSGKVEEHAEVFDEAQVMRWTTIRGNCKVGGTAVMVSGVYTTGVFMEGRHEGGDEGEKSRAESETLSSRIKTGFKDMLGLDKD